MTPEQKEIQRLRKGCLAAYVRSGHLVGTDAEWMLDNWLALAEGRMPPRPGWPLVSPKGSIQAQNNLLDRPRRIPSRDARARRRREMLENSRSIVNRDNMRSFWASLSPEDRAREVNRRVGRA